MDEDPEFTQALDIVLHDLRAEGAVLPLVSVADGYGLMLHEPDGSGHGVRWPESGSAADRLASLADQVQEWAVEALWSAGVPAVWPHCPRHPDSHPLRATVATAEVGASAAAAAADVDGAAAAGAAAAADAKVAADVAAVWVCPKTAVVVARVGELPAIWE